MLLQQSKPSASNRQKITFSTNYEIPEEKSFIRKLQPRLQKRPSLKQNNNDNDNKNLDENQSNGFFLK